MNRKDLEALGLEKEAIDSIMTINGKDIEKAKADIDTLNTTIKAKDEAILKANETIKSFEGVDVASLTQKIKDYETQTSELTTKHDQELRDFRLKTAIKEKIITSKAKNVDDIMKLYEPKGVSLGEDGSLIGFDDTFKPFKDARPHLFEGEETKGAFQASSGQSGGGSGKENSDSTAEQIKNIVGTR